MVFCLGSPQRLRHPIPSPSPSQGSNLHCLRDNTRPLTWCSTVGTPLQLLKIPLYLFKIQNMSSLPIVHVFLIHIIVKSEICMGTMRWFCKCFHLENEDSKAEGHGMTWLWPLVNWWSCCNLRDTPAFTSPCSFHCAVSLELFFNHFLNVLFSSPFKMQHLCWALDERYS